MKALFAVSSLGLGHATRTLVVIKHYLEKGYDIDIISFGNALKYLKNELKQEKVGFFELQDYPNLERGFGIKFYFYLIIDLLKTTKIIKKENQFVKSIAKNYDFIFSDGRYGVYDKKVPSYLLTHQLAFVVPKTLKIFSYFSDLANIKYFKNFTKVFIPDYKNKEKNLAGKLSHPKWIEKINYEYIGILSDFYEKKEVDKKEKIDYLFTITGYLLEQKEKFLNQLIKKAHKLKGKKVFVLGDMSSFYKKELENDITIYSYLTSKQKKNIFNSANIIISRSGYTTIMDLIELDKKAILFPTKNQTEQEYLAKYLGEKKVFITGNKINLLEDYIKGLKNLKTINFEQKTKQALDLIDKTII